MNRYPVNFFMGANTPVGFVSLFDGLYDPHDKWSAYLIKGGPGTGKSGLMHRVAAAVEQAGFFVEYVPCSSDPDSLDAIRIPALKTCLADATSPHVIEPKFPGAVEQLVNLGEFWDMHALQKSADQIRRAAAINSGFHQRSVKFLSAAGSLLEDSQRVAAECTDLDKVHNYAARFASREFGADHGKVGRESRRFLSAVTPKGLLVQNETFLSLCSRVIVVEDETGAASRAMMQFLRGYALAAGLDVIACYCPMSPRDTVEHLIFPQLGLGLYTAKAFHPAEFTPERRIHARRFMDVDALQQHRYRLRFNRKASGELLDEAVNLLKQAKTAHDVLEKYYIPHMDFKAVEAVGDAIITQILCRAGNREPLL